MNIGTPPTTPDAEMAKLRLFDGLELPANLYPHQRKVPGKWRYKRPDGSMYPFEASTVDAIAAAIAMNEQFANGAQIKPKPPTEYGRLSVRRHVEDFIVERENREPTLKKKKSWDNRKTYLRQFATLNTGRNISSITLLHLQDWWDTITGHAQRARKAEFRRFFNYLITRGLCPKLEANPFSDQHGGPTVEMASRPAKQRLRLTDEQFWSIYDRAGEMGLEFLQIAMGISLVTTLRRGDICELKWDQHVIGNLLRKQISKSHAQLSERFEMTGGRAEPSNLSWDLNQHQLLRQLINRARELSLQNYRCPYVLNYRVPIRMPSKKREHPAQVFPEYITRAFAEARDSLDEFKALPEKSRPAFHEIRALASRKLKEAGYSLAMIKEGMAHTDEKITASYQSGHGTQWTEIGLVMPQEVIGRAF